MDGSAIGLAARNFRFESLSVRPIFVNPLFLWGGEKGSSAFDSVMCLDVARLSETASAAAFTIACLHHKKTHT